MDIFGKESSSFFKICNLETIIKEQFYSCGFDIDKLIIFYKNYLSNLELDFIDSVHDECIGYTMDGTRTIEKAKTINEVLHFIHSYIVNNNQILQIIPLINTKTNNYQYPIRLRGINTLFFEQLFNQFPLDSDVGWTDMVIINDKKLPGVNKVNKNSIGATGVIEVPIKELSQELFKFISMVPMDADMVFDDVKTF